MAAFCCYSVVKLCLTLWAPMDCSMPGSPAPHHLLELAQVHAHWITDAHLWMKCSFDISNFLEEISSLFPLIVFLYFFLALFIEEGLLFSPRNSLELRVELGVAFPFSFASLLSSATCHTAAECDLWCGWASSNQLKAWITQKTDLSQAGRSSARKWSLNLNHSIGSSLGPQPPTHPPDFGLASSIITSVIPWNKVFLSVYTHTHSLCSISLENPD